MPYIVTTKRRSVLKTRSPYEADDVIDVPVSRRAVATLDEARTYLFDRFGSYWTSGVYETLPREVLALPESGGTVGPLPDGTVIEVSLTPTSPVLRMHALFDAGATPYRCDHYTGSGYGICDACSCETFNACGSNLQERVTAAFNAAQTREVT